MDAYRVGATGNTVLKKTREMKKSHRVPLMIDQQPRVSYDRSRGRRIVMNIERDEREAEEDEVVFDQESFAVKVRQLIWKGNPMRNFVELGKVMREHGREAPRADYLDGKLYFDELVEEERWQKWLEEDVSRRALGGEEWVEETSEMPKE